MTDEVVRLRPPRYFQPDGLVRPYIRHEAEGNKILQVCHFGMCVLRTPFILFLHTEVKTF